MIQKLKQKAARALRWSEKFTKTDMIYLTKGGFWLALGHGIQVLSGLVLAVAFANLLPKEAYGTYQFIMSVAAILSALTLSGMSTAIKRAVANGNEGALPYGFKTQIVWSSGIALAGGALALYYFANGNSTLASAFLIVGALSPFIEGFSLYKSYLIGSKRFRESAFLGLWRRPIFIVTLLVALFFTDDPAILIFVYFASSALSAGLLYLLVVRKYDLKATPDAELTSYSKHLSAIGIFSTLGNNMDKILIFHFLGAAPVATYMLALLPLTHLYKAFGLVGELVLPKFARKDFPTLKATLFRKVLIFFSATTAATILYIFAAPHIYAALFPTYPEAVFLSQIIILALLTKPNTLYGQVFAAHGAKRVQHFIQISTTSVKLFSLVVLLPFFGIWGAVYSLLLAHMYWSIIVTILFYRYKS